MSSRGRPRRAQVLDPNFMEIAQDTIQCITCVETMARNSARGHLSSAKHARRLEIELEETTTAEANRRAYQSAYASSAQPLQNISTLATSTRPLHAFLPSPLASPSYETNYLMEDAFPIPPLQPDTDIEADNERVHQRLQDELAFLEHRASMDDFEGQFEDETLPGLENRFADFGVNDKSEDVEFDADTFMASMASLHGNGRDYSPYPNRTTFLLDVLDNLPRLRLSGSHMKMILWTMKNCNPADVPSFDKLRKTQDDLRQQCAVESYECKSDIGNIFYVNSIADIVRRDFSNPETASRLQFYPEDTSPSTALTEVWQFARWREYPLDQLTPSYECQHRRYYVNELATLCDGRLVIPYIWVTFEGRVHAYCREAVRSDIGLIVSDVVFRIACDDLRKNYNDYTEQNHAKPVFAPSFKSFEDAMPNRYRDISDDEDLFTVWLSVWADDVSGGQSKQYQKHTNVYMSNTNLPGQLLQQEYHVHFVTTSPQASATELLEAVTKEVKSTHKAPARAYNAATRQTCLFRLQIPNLPADNPQQSEQCSHIGHNGLFFCRVCKAGGTAEYKESVIGYEELHNTGVPRSSLETRKAILEQICRASYGIAAPIEELQKMSGCKDRVAQHWIPLILAKATEIKSKSARRRPPKEISDEVMGWFATQTTQSYNALLDVEYLDVSQDTSVEILHTVLLGTNKYMWHDFHSEWTAAQRNTFTIRLQATNVDGLNIPAIRASYMMQYRNGLIGKHFKTLMQCLPFHIRDICSSSQFRLANAIGRLGAHLWISEIQHLDEYLEDLEILIDNVLDAFDELDPAKILVKIKLHLLKHLPEHIRRFGPAVRFSTEVYECFNAVFRMSSVLSNHLAPSRDIAQKNADLDRMKHTLSGGYWSTENHEWCCAGKDVVALVRQTPVLQRHLGWVSTDIPVSGRVRCPGRIHRKIVTYSESQAYTAEVQHLVIRADSEWEVGIESIAESGDRCGVGSWIVIQVAGSEPFIGQIKDVLRGDDLTGVLFVEQFEVGSVCHPFFGLPLLLRIEPPRRHVVSTLSVKFSFNVQHDCVAAGCGVSTQGYVRQERQDTQQPLLTIKHVDDRRFIINLYAIHNAARLRAYLPRSLTKPHHLHVDRIAFHSSLSAGLQITQTDKRAETQAKAADTRLKNKRKRADRDERERHNSTDDDQE